MLASSLGVKGMFARLKSCRRGAVSVEAALVMPILVMLVVGMMEFGVVLFTFMTLQSAVREATRAASVNYIDTDEIETEVRAHLPRWSREDTEVEVSETSPSNPSLNVITVTATLPARSATPVHLFSTVANAWDLVTEITMKQEQPL